MRFLIVGAGAVGGYFGGRLVQKGEDVTCLVRAQRQKQLQAHGLVVHSVAGDFQCAVKAITYGEATEPFDVIILTVKAYNMAQLKQDLAPYIGAQSVIVPLLNGYNHIPALQEQFGEEHVLGGCCHIETTLDEQGAVVHTSQLHNITFGEWAGGTSERVQAIRDRLAGAGFNVTLSENVQRDVWNKYVFIASMSGITTLMQAPIGPIVANAHSSSLLKRLLAEVVSIAKLVAAPLAEGAEQVVYQTMAVHLHPGMKSSMQRDMEKGLPVETDHIHGALLALAEQRGMAADQYPALQAVYSHLQLYEQTGMAADQYPALQAVYSHLQLYEQTLRR